MVLTFSKTQVYVLAAIVMTVGIGIIGSARIPESMIPILGFCGVITANLFTLLKVDSAAIETAQKLDETVTTTASTLKDSDANTNGKLDTIHKLVNSDRGAQLNISALALRRVADMSKDPKDATIAGLAESAYAEHVKRQAEVDKANGVAIPVATA